MSICGYFVTTVIIVTSGLLTIGSSVKNKMCFDVSNQHICFFQPQEQSGWNQWEKVWNICQRNSATLPIIENREVQKRFEQYLSNISLNSKKIWLGGSQMVTKKEWQWSNKKPFYEPDLILDGGQNPNTEALIRRFSDSAFRSNATLEYAAVEPSSPCSYICQYSASRCPADDSIRNEDHGCLKVFHDRLLNASEAAIDCNKTGGNLAVFDGDEFLTKAPKAYQRIKFGNSTGYYIGLRRIDTKSWFWMRSNNENSTMEGNYNNWSDRNNNSNGDCLFATANIHRWEAGGCYHFKHFICQTIEIQATENTTAKEPSETNTSGNLALIVGLSIGITLLAVIIILVVIIVNQRRKVRTTSATRSITENEEQNKELNRITAHENETDNYAELIYADNYAELIYADNCAELIYPDNYIEVIL